MLLGFQQLTRPTTWALAVVAATVAGCDKAQLLAPTSSTITVSAPIRFLPSGGSTEVTAYVLEQAGTPVQNGTVVRFSATLGRVDPVEVQTRNGLALTTFFADNSSGVAEIRATSGAASGGEAKTNVVQITVGAAAVNTVTLRANPASVGPSGGSVELIATVVAESGQGLPGVGVTFSADQGILAASTVSTNSAGEARTTFTTSRQATVSATAGTKTSEKVTIGLRPGPIITITCAPAAGTGNCAALQASGSSAGATVILTVTRPSDSSALRSVVLDFGDGSSQTVGSLSGGSATAPASASMTHTYSAPTAVDDPPRTHTATVRATDINGESTEATTTITIAPRAPLNVTISTATKETATAAGQRWTFTATAKEGTASASVQSYEWDFGDGSSATTSGETTAHVYSTGLTGQRYVVTVTVKTADGRSASGRLEILVDKFP